MAHLTQLDYDDMMLHVEELNGEERDALKGHLFRIRAARDLTPNEKIALLRITTDRTTRLMPFSDRREDWYSDEGR